MAFYRRRKRRATDTTMRFILLLSICPALFLACQGNSASSVQTVGTPLPDQLPTDAKPPAISISDLNCWVEKSNFFVIGLCNNESNEWQKIWLRMDPLDGTGQALQLTQGAENTFLVLADAVPPRGRSSFFAYWPLSSFAGVPDSAHISGAGAVTVPAGPILIAEQQSGVKMRSGASSAPDAVETRWLASVVLSNPLQIQAVHPKAELLLYGTDKRLWMSTILDPEDPTQQDILTFERRGPMAPGEKRQLSCYISYDNLPTQLQALKIGRVAFLPFEGRKK